MDGEAVLDDATGAYVETLLSQFVADFWTVRGFKPRRVYLTWTEYAAVMRSQLMRAQIFPQSPILDPNPGWMYDGAQIRRSREAVAIREWDLTPF